MNYISKKNVIDALLNNEKVYLKNENIIIECSKNRKLVVDVEQGGFEEIHFTLSSPFCMMKVYYTIKQGRELEDMISLHDYLVRQLIKTYNDNILLEL